MGLASRFYTGRKTKKAVQPASARPVRSCVEPITPLEKRVLFSATIQTVNLTWEGHTLEAVPNQYVTQLNSQAAFDKLTVKYDFTNVKSLGGQNMFSFDSTQPLSLIQKLTADKAAFTSLSPDLVQHVASTSSNDPSLVNQWGLVNTGQVEPYDYNLDGVVTPYNEIQNPTPPAIINYPSPPYPNENQVGTVGDDIDAEGAWDITTGSKSVVVAVLDTGMDITHPDLTPNLWTNPLDTAANNYDGDGYPNDIHGFNFISNDSDPSDDFGHGTHVSGIIGAAGNNGIGVTGVNWNVSLLPVKVLDDTGAGTDSSIIAGINYCITLKDLGINIVAMNQSLGETNFPQNPVESAAIQQAGRAGILDVVAAGNDGLDLDYQQSTPAKFSLTYPSVITVAAVDNQFNLAAFSDYGADSVDLAAPGVDIYSTTPTYTVPNNTPQESDLPAFSENYGYDTGTSMATPMVTGIIALEAAANPSATPAQLKAALLAGVTYDPKLAGVNGLPNKVLTVGVANAFGAVENILNPFVSSNTAHQGNWVNFYGSTGAFVVGESTTFPSFVSAEQSGGSPVILGNTSRNLAALQQSTDPSQRISAYEASATSESINLNFTDGQSHQTSIYLADIDKQHRVETVSILDADTNKLLNSQTISNFSKGEYLTWNLRGHVIIYISNDAGPNAVYSGLFFDSPTTSPSTSVSTDTTTEGYNWRNQYGSQGAVVVGDTSQTPSYVSFVSVLGETGVVLKSSTRNATSLQKVSSVNSGIQAYWSTATSMDVNVGVNDGLVHNVTLYFADYNHQKRQERIQVINSFSGAILAQQDISNFNNGEFLTFGVAGSTTFRIIDTAGPSAVLSGVFFDAPFGENASFLGADTTSGGNWLVSRYGLTTSYIVGYNFPGVNDPANPAISEVGASQAVLSENSSDSAALIDNYGVASTRVAAYLYATNSMTLDYNPGDLLQHTVALYFADYQNLHRVESVTLYNGNTNQVLSHQTISNFRHGEYLVFNVRGPVLITINNGAYPNAVLSGVFTN